jgi:alkylation response protein AidB-like acyl-CoA dehydrogenase
MAIYRAPLEDIRFILNDLLNAPEILQKLGYEDISADMIDTIFEEGAKLCEKELLPLNLSGDQEGCVYENGVVRTPKGFKEAYKLYCDNGWGALACDPAYGGQGVPHLVDIIFSEMMCATNLAFSMYPLLTRGAYSAIHAHCTEELKKTYLPKLVEGSWTGTMCLTEPHAGTDLRMIRTRSEPQNDGTYKITGTKIFISAGEHDISDNIIHLVLAKLPDAPEGIKGISLFLVPKFNVKADGSVGSRNHVHCGSIEHKMGIKASSTCVMNFDGAAGYLIGQKHEGMKCMFTMMNAARLEVGIQGLGLAETAYQSAASYAKERLQGRSISGTKAPNKPADPIIVHPDIRKMLLTMRAYNQGARALAYWVALNLDISYKSKDLKKRQEADDLVALMTPIIKSFFTDYGFDATNLGMQVHGGHGYIADYGVEQLARDARIGQIYEGTNSIQAFDLIGRKIGLHNGRLLRRFFHPATKFVEANKERADLQEFLLPLAKALTKLQQATMWMAQKGMSDKEDVLAVATEYLKLFALTAIGFMWAQMAKISLDKIAKNEDSNGFHKAKIATGRFYMTKLIGQTSSLLVVIMSGKQSIMDLDEAAF